MVAEILTQGAPSAPSGWTQQAQVNYYSTYYLTLYTKVAGGSEPSSYTWTAGTSVRSAGISSYTGVDTTTPISGTPTSAVTDAAGSLAAGSITVAANSLLVMSGAAFDQGYGAITGLSWSGGGTERWEENYGPNAQLSNAHDEAVASAGATGTRTLTVAGASPPVILVGMLALKSGVISTPATVTAVAATASGAAPAPSLTTWANVTGVTATANAALLAPSMRGQAVVTGVAATASGVLLAPVVLAGGAYTVTPPAMTASGVLPAPSIISRAMVVATTMTATGSLLAPSVGIAVSVTAPLLTATALLPAPSVAGKAVVSGVAAHATGALHAPLVFGQMPGLVVSPVMAANAGLLVPGVRGKASVTAVRGVASAAMLVPSVGVPVTVATPLLRAVAAMGTPGVHATALVLPAAMTALATLPVPAVAIGFTSPELVTTMPDKAHTLIWSDPAWPDLSRALVGVTVSPGFEALVFDPYTQGGDTVVLDLSASDAATLIAGRIAPYQVTADFDDRRALVLAQGLWVNATPGVVVSADDLRHTQTITRGTAATLTWSDPAWPVLDDVLVAVVVGAGRNERRYEAVIDAGDVVTLNLTATGALLDPGVYPYEVRADFDATRTRQLATGLLTVNAA